MSDAVPCTPLSEAELHELAYGIFFLWQKSTHGFVYAGEAVKGLKLPQYVIIRALEHGPRRMSELAEITGTSSANVTGMVDRLVERGLATRTSHPTDRRVVLVSLTPLCREMIQEQLHRFETRVAELLEPLDAQECKEFVRLLAKARGAQPEIGELPRDDA